MQCVVREPLIAVHAFFWKGKFNRIITQYIQCFPKTSATLHKGYHFYAREYINFKAATSRI